MDINENGMDRLVFSSHVGSAGYGCSFELSEISYNSIAKLLYFKICYDIKERLRNWVNYLENLLHT